MAMRFRVAAFSLAAVVCLALAGCGSGTNITAGSGLEGSYAGIYRVVDGSTTEQGSLTLVIGHDGRIAGVLTENATAQTRTLTGTVNDRKRLDGTLAYPAATFTVKGDLSLVGGNNLVGVLERRDAAGAPAGTFTVDCLVQ